MKILSLTQNTPGWFAARAKHFCASEAPAMMGVSKYMTRDALLRQKATGHSDDIDSATQALFDAGHAAETAARKIVEERLGPLSPVVATDDAGWLLASFDGINESHTVGWEHKLWNKRLADQVQTKELEPMYFWQLEHQILVGGLKGVMFTCSDGTSEKCVSMAYRPVPGRAQQLIAGWKQFQADLENYQYVEDAPAPVVAPIDDLPALTVELVGQVKHSNLVSFQAAVLARIQAINTDLKTDEDFATADKMVKFLDDGEKRLDLVRSQALAQTATIDELFRAIDSLKGEMRAKRLTLDKLVKARKDAIREEIVRGGVDALASHIAALNTRLGKPYMPTIQVDFASVIRGKKTIVSLRNALSTELARAKIAANEAADRIDVNLNTLCELASEHAFLFADTAQLVQKANDDFTTLVKLRIAEHREAEAKRVEQERERIRQEEAAKLAAQQPAPQLAAQPVAAPPTQSAKPTVKLTPKGPRPDDDAIISVLALHYRVHESKIIEWLLAMDLNAARKQRKST